MSPCVWPGSELSAAVGWLGVSEEDRVCTGPLQCLYRQGKSRLERVRRDLRYGLRRCMSYDAGLATLTAEEENGSRLVAC